MLLYGGRFRGIKKRFFPEKTEGREKFFQEKEDLGAVFIGFQNVGIRRVSLSKRTDLLNLGNRRFFGKVHVGASFVKKQAGKLLHTRISPLASRFLCGKKITSLLKEIYFLPQRRGRCAARRRKIVRKEEFHGALRAVFLPDGRVWKAGKR